MESHCIDKNSETSGSILKIFDNECKVAIGNHREWPLCFANLFFTIGKRYLWH